MLSFFAVTLRCCGKVGGFRLPTSVAGLVAVRSVYRSNREGVLYVVFGAPGRTKRFICVGEVSDHRSNGDTSMWGENFNWGVT